MILISAWILAEFLALLPQNSKKMIYSEFGVHGVSTKQNKKKTGEFDLIFV